MDLDLEKTAIGTLAVTHPEVIPILEKYHLDYSCHGEQSLENACIDEGLYAEILERELLEVTSSCTKQTDLHIENWEILEIITLIKNNFHSYFISTVPVLSRLVEIASVQYQDKFPNIKKIRTILTWMEDELDYHIMQEREELFPSVQKFLVNKEPYDLTIKSLIDDMSLEFEDLHYGFREIRLLHYSEPSLNIPSETINKIFEKLTEFEEKTHYYLHIGKNILFPKIILMEKSPYEQANATQ